MEPATFEKVKNEVYSLLTRIKRVESRNKVTESLTDSDSPFTIELSSKTEVYFVDTTSGDILIILPRAQECQGRKWTFKKLESANDIHLQPVESQEVDGNLTFTFSTQYEFYTIISDGTNFYTV